MPALRDLQAAFAAHVVAHVAGDDHADLAGAVVGDSIAAEARLRVYRHHVAHSLVGALGATFSTVKALVGDDFFRGLAQAYVARELPTQPVLAEYGAGFPEFLASSAAGRDLPYLADMARLDWALNAAFHSPAGLRLAAAALAGIEPERLLSVSLALPEGAALVRSDFPIDRIWHASQPEAAVDRVDLGAGGAALLVLRRADDAAFIVLDPGEAAFVAAVADGVTLEQAAECAVAAEAMFDLSTAFTRLLTLEAFAALQ